MARIFPTLMKFFPIMSWHCLQAVLLSQLDPGGGLAAAAAAGAWDPTWAMPPAPKAAIYAATGALAGCATGLLGIGESQY